jgi:hypothetical protein
MLRLALKQLAILLIAGLIAGCSTGKTSTTDRTAVELALLSETAELALMRLNEAEMEGKSFYLDTSEFKAVDQEYIISTLRLRLLDMGMKLSEKREEADVIVYPRSAIANMDETKVLIGIPALPIAIPGIGAVELPELALFKRMHQRAHNKIGVYAIDSKDRSLAFDLDRSSGTRYYTRWTILIVINFRTTDLPVPYTKKTLEEMEERRIEKELREKAD